MCCLLLLLLVHGRCVHVSVVEGLDLLYHKVHVVVLDQQVCVVELTDDERLPVGDTGTAEVSRLAALFQVCERSRIGQGACAQLLLLMMTISRVLAA